MTSRPYRPGEPLFRWPDPHAKLKRAVRAEVARERREEDLRERRLDRPPRSPS